MEIPRCLLLGISHDRQHVPIERMTGNTCLHCVAATARANHLHTVLSQAALTPAFTSASYVATRWARTPAPTHQVARCRQQNIQIRGRSQVQVLKYPDIQPQPARQLDGLKMIQAGSTPGWQRPNKSLQLPPPTPATQCYWVSVGPRITWNAWHVLRAETLQRWMPSSASAGLTSLTGSLSGSWRARC